MIQPTWLKNSFQNIQAFLTPVEQHLDCLLADFNQIYLSSPVNTTYESVALLTASAMIHDVAQKTKENMSTIYLHEDFSSVLTAASDPFSLSTMEPINPAEETDVNGHNEDNDNDDVEDDGYDACDNPPSYVPFTHSPLQLMIMINISWLLIRKHGKGVFQPIRRG